MAALRAQPRIQGYLCGRFTGPAEDTRISVWPFYGPGRRYEDICKAVLQTGPRIRGYLHGRLRAGRGYKGEGEHEEVEG